MNFPNFNPPAPGAVNIKTFPELRRFLITYIVNQWMQYVNNYFTQELVPLLNTNQYSYGNPVPGTAAITPNAQVFQITGSPAIATVYPMPTATGPPSGPFFAIGPSGFTTVTTGNIANAVTVAPGHMGIFAFDRIAQKWSVVTS